MVNELVCYIVVSEFELQSRYYVHLQTLRTLLHFPTFFFSLFLLSLPPSLPSFSSTLFYHRPTHLFCLRTSEYLLPPTRYSFSVAIIHVFLGYLRLAPVRCTCQREACAQSSVIEKWEEEREELKRIQWQDKATTLTKNKSSNPSYARATWKKLNVSSTAHVKKSKKCFVFGLFFFNWSFFKILI